MREISTEEGDAIIRASWPARRQDIDYAAHTAECADCDDYDEPPMPVWAGWVMVALMLASGALIDTETAIDAEGLPLEFFATGLRGMLVFPVRGTTTFSDGGTSCVGKVSPGGVFVSTAGTDVTELLTESMEIEVLAAAGLGVAEAYFVLVTTGG
jgi:hypothetical protein